MADLLIKNIKTLHQTCSLELKSKINGVDTVPSIDHAYLCIRNGRIENFGTMKDCPNSDLKTIDLKGLSDVIPCFVDSHTHAVHAESRESEFKMKLQGVSYEEIAKNGGGILNSARKLTELSEDQLYERSKMRVNRIIASGTGALEIKSGYGLSKEAELKMLRVIQRLKANFKIPIKATFLGAHAIPERFNSDAQAYLDYLEDELVPVIKDENLADYIDIFCEKGFFSAEQTRRIIDWGLENGWKAKIHTNQFNSIGGIEVAVEKRILSVDHLEVLTEKEIKLLANSKVLPVFLPGAAFFLNMDFPSGRAAIDGGLAPVLASDFNPGSCPSYSMELIQSLACVKMRMLPEEAFNASTINAAYALELENEVGSISRGKLGNVAILKEGKNLVHLAYDFGSETIAEVIIQGEVWQRV